MTDFRSRSIQAVDTLGERLRRMRRENGLSLETVSRRTGVSLKHLQAIEDGRYGDLPGAVYARSFIRAYARALDVREDAALQQFDREYAIAAKLRPSPPADPTSPQPPRVWVTPQRMRWAAVVLLTIGILVYLGLEIRNLNSPPSLTIESPVDQLTTAARTVELIGQTDPETVVTANGRPIVVDRSGRFREVLDLQVGLNTVVIRAERKRGSATTVVRQILVQPID
ncbi:MAG: helix-turn-helix domain-containing protein [Candidatus Kerfeldbacteria bacterium]|nr:helix-turn-helix domain-containing protein [Candidatus Kerfeldbacteria bacterium]